MEIAPAATSTAQVVCVRSTGRALHTRVVCPPSLYKDYNSYHFTFIAERKEISRWNAKFSRGLGRYPSSTARMRTIFEMAFKTPH